MATSGDSFLRAKFKKKPAEAPNFILGADRCNMVELILKDSDWLMCDRYEAFHDVRASEAKAHLDTVIREHYIGQSPDPIVQGVCGVDALLHMKSISTVKGSLFVVNRQQDDGADPHVIVRQHHLRDHIRVVWADDWEKREASSSGLRRLWSQGESIAHLTSEAVIQCSYNAFERF